MTTTSMSLCFRGLAPGPAALYADHLHPGPEGPQQLRLERQPAIPGPFPSPLCFSAVRRSLRPDRPPWPAGAPRRAGVPATPPHTGPCPGDRSALFPILQQPLRGGSPSSAGSGSWPRVATQRLIFTPCSWNTASKSVIHHIRIVGMEVKGHIAQSVARPGKLGQGVLEQGPVVGLEPDLPSGSQDVPVGFQKALAGQPPLGVALAWARGRRSDVQSR